MQQYKTQENADPFDKGGQQEIESIHNTHHSINTRADRQRSLQQLMKCVDYVTDSIIHTLLSRLLLCQLYGPHTGTNWQLY